MRKLLLAILLCSCQFAFADFQKITGQFASGTGGATTTVSGLGFTPKAIIFWSHGKTTNPESGLASWSLGFADGTHVVEAGWAGNDAAATTLNGQGFQTARALQIFTSGTPTAGTGGSISSVAFNSGNFVVTFNATPASAWLIDYIAIGGSDITNVFVGNFADPTTTGAFSVTTPGFKPDFIMMTSAFLTAGGTTTAVNNIIGCAVSSTKRWSFGATVANGQTVSANVNGQTIMRTDNVLVGQSTANAVTVLADFTSFDTNGFTLNFATAPASAWLTGYLVIKGGRWDAGSGTKPTTATTQTVTGESFQPSLIGLFTSSPTASNSNVSNAVSSFGASDGTNQEFANAFHNDAINTVAKSSGSASAVLLDRDGTNNPSAAFTSFNSDGWTITWNATGSAREVGWFTAAQNATSFVPGGPFVEIP